ncbi:2-hydroxyglutaryl-CoA dehydratase, partial [bacterium]|nr:2-hydroxyglutaryl-CoA dehydratase [bacterium]
MNMKTASSISTTSKIEYVPPFTLGVDSGSLTAKAVIMDGNRKIVSNSVVQLDYVSEKAVRMAIDQAMTEAGLKLDDMAYVVSTGYGRRRIEYAGKFITEISCHAKGANYLNPDVRTIIDIGGQDSKCISVDSSGNVQNFVMNDKC